jgi:formate/nitrite transporter FocA (FNT family)
MTITSPELAEHPANAGDNRSIHATVEKVADLFVKKVASPVTFLIQSLVGGAMVGFGVMLSLVVSTGVTSPGIASLLMGLAFGMSFVLILASGMSLITADMAAGFLAVLQRKLSVLTFVRSIVIGLVGNIVGIAVFVGIGAWAGGPYLGAFAQRAALVGTLKAAQPGWTQFLLAILCTWLLQTAMFMFFKSRNEVARMGLAFYGPFAFVIGGTQHVIANVGFLGLPLALAALHAGVAEGGISWGLGTNGLLTNVLITTAGNLIGGAIFAALPFQLIAWQQHRAHKG